MTDQRKTSFCNGCLLAEFRQRFGAFLVEIPSPLPEAPKGLAVFAIDEDDEVLHYQGWLADPSHCEDLECAVWADSQGLERPLFMRANERAEELGEFIVTASCEFIPPPRGRILGAARRRRGRRRRRSSSK